MTNKNNQKPYNLLVIGSLSKKHGLTKRFINQCLNGERTSITAQTIVREYKELDKKIADVLAD